MRKDLIINSSTLICSTDAFQQDCLRYEIIKISGGKNVCHLQGGNKEFKFIIPTLLKRIGETN